MNLKKLFILFALILTSMTSYGAIDDSVALKGVKEGKVVFDVNINEPQKLTMYLQVIKETYKNFKDQNVKPNMILAIRGQAVTHLTNKALKKLPQLKSILQELIALKGVRLDSCEFAAKLFKIDSSDYLSGINAVGNGFITIVGHHQKGYALVPLY